jgi:hypothetical protein
VAGPSELGRIFPEADDPAAVAALAARCAIKRPVVIFAMTPRVGSTGMLSLLAKRFGFSDIYELLNPRGVVDVLSRENGLSALGEYFRYIDELLVGDILAFKVSWPDFAFLTAAGVLEVLFPRARFVYLDRLDIESQAVSLYVAEQTGVWHVTANEPGAERRQVVYDRNAIDRHLLETFAAKANWLRFFGARQLLPLTVYYETIEHSTREALLEICRYAGVAYLQLADMPDWQDGAYKRTGSEDADRLVRKYRHDRYPLWSR